MMHYRQTDVAGNVVQELIGWATPVRETILNRSGCTLDSQVDLAAGYSTANLG